MPPREPGEGAAVHEEAILAALKELAVAITDHRLGQSTHANMEEAVVRVQRWVQNAHPSFSINAIVAEANALSAEICRELSGNKILN